MNKSMNMTESRMPLRARLLATASGVVLLASVCMAQPASAAGEDSDRPIVWIDLGGDFSRIEDAQESYLPAFALVSPRLPFITVSPDGIEKAPVASWNGNAKITIAPEGMDWALSAGIIYGRSDHHGSVRQTTTTQATPYNGQHVAYQKIAAKSHESHMIVDFQAGKDVGLGMVGRGGHSRVNIGIRYTQLNAAGDADILYQPTNSAQDFNKFDGSFDVKRKFTGIGPSFSWDASASLLGDATGGGISLDWGVNSALLFGRQQAHGRHRTGEVVQQSRYQGVVYQTSAPLDRSRQAVVPNLGGFAGISWRYPNARISIGYRADMFFGAMDSGVDARKSESRGFYGPFAGISIGVGD